jgi:single-stranded-DNA-specific exonuclease
VIAPRVNAAGRMDDARKAVQLFIEHDPQKAMVLAEILHNDNAERKEADRSITAEALDMMIKDLDIGDKRSTVVYQEHWHKGVVGIVASRLIETHHRPTVVLTLSNGLATGSARSVPGFNLYEAIYACREYLTAYGGHFAAAGLSMLPEHVDPFREKFELVVSDSIDIRLLTPEIVIDNVLDFTDIKDSFYQIICQMEPFGPENMRPVFITRNVVDTGFSKIVKEQHVRFVVRQHDITLTGIGFNMADKFAIIASKKPFDIVYSIDENEWNGTKSLQLKIVDVKESIGEWVNG